ncbi:MAG: aminotransferase class V-fold PLP-dependent enzyme [Cellvibrionaceae bacterium]
MSDLIQAIRESVIGDNAALETPFGLKPLVYADYTASGRSLDFIENFIRQRVLPFYANTHSESSFTGAQTTALREQARDQIRQCVKGSDEDQIIFCGSGATSAINKLIDILNLRLPADLDDRYDFQSLIGSDNRPVVFIGPYEHHSNELPWRESIADLVTIPLTRDGQLDTNALEEQLAHYEHRPLKIGSFSAASNVTGVKTDVESVTALLHQYGAFSFWDYAAAAPYVDINMSDYCEQRLHKDAAFISPHKFIGGPGTPGVLVVKKSLLNNRIPAMPGGGTVTYVTPETHRYSDNHERREEAGTPAIIEAIRAGLVFKLQQDVGLEEIEQREASFISRAIERWSSHNNIDILGNPQIPRLSIASLRITHQGQDLHYGFVVALLNDLFGIQARGGCSCAGPYGHSLLAMNADYSRAIETQISAGHLVLRPGWVRLNFNYFIDQATFDYLLQAIELIADHGWRLLPFYQFDMATGAWRFQGQQTPLMTRLSDFDGFANHQPPVALEQNFDHYLSQAEAQLMQNNRCEARYSLALSTEARALCWFVLPQSIEL